MSLFIVLLFPFNLSGDQYYLGKLLDDILYPNLNNA
jgi:hypothetical protein